MACILHIKPGVTLTGLSPEMLLGIQVVHSCYAAIGAPTCVITSVTDGQHGIGSLHYTGDGVDFRIWDIDAPNLTALIRQSLGHGQYDVVLERNHIHVEFQPKQGS